MPEMVTISRPQMAQGRWRCRVLLSVAGESVEIYISASPALVSELNRRVRRYVRVEGGRFGEEAVGCAGCGGFGGDDFGGLFDSIVKVVKKIADNPIVRAIPYAGTIAQGVSAAASVYQGIRSGHPAAKRRLTQIRTDAKRGIPAAQDALKQLQAVARADSLRNAAKAGKPAALRRLRAIGTGIAKAEPAAFEAAKILERLDALEAGPLAPEPPIAYPLSMDDMDDSQAAEEISGAIAQRRAMSPKHRRLYGQLSALAAKNKPARARTAA
jgi:hypothetical protein